MGPPPGMPRRHMGIIRAIRKPVEVDTQARQPLHDEGRIVHQRLNELGNILPPPPHHGVDVVNHGGVLGQRCRSYPTLGHDGVRIAQPQFRR